jgi:ribosomal protein L11 methyltransferase
MYRIIKLELKSDFNVGELDSLIHYAIDHCHSLGVEEFSLEENQVDEFLGERAYSGGDLPLSVLDEVDLKNQKMDQRIFKFFFQDPEGLHEIFLNKISTLGLKGVVEECEEKDWDVEWKKTYAPVEIDDELWIVPEWMMSEFDEKKSVFINPGQGFGTGKHETTFMCLKLMRTMIDQNPEHVLDLGCGSGILGIAILRFGNPRVSFCDIDKNALRNTLQNLTLNYRDRDLSGCELVLRERLNVIDSQHDLIFANILLSALKDEYETIYTSLRPDGCLIASGLLNNQVDEFVNHFSGFDVIEVMTMNDWSALLLKKR